MYTDNMETIKRWIILFVLVLCAVGLAACATSPKTPTAIVRLSPTPTSTFTQTPRPTSTRVPSPTSTPEPTVTPDIVATVVATSQPRVYAPLLSPDGKWRAEVIIYDCVPIDTMDQNAYEELRLVEISTSIETVIDTQLQNCGGLGAVGLASLFWSPTSRYFYYTRAREGFPDGCGYWERPLTRLDLANQTIEQLGGGLLSPDKTKIAAWQWPEKELVIWAIDGGEFARVSAFVPDANIGPIAWSPNSRSVVYLQAELECYPLGNTYVVHLDLSSLKQELLLESEEPSWGSVIWESPNQLNLFDENSKEWRYNLITQKLELKP